MRNTTDLQPLMKQLVIVALFLFVDGKWEDFPKFPLNDQTRPLIEDLGYKTAMGNLMGTIATRIGRRTNNDDRLIELCACVHETKTVSDYARCLAPFLKKRRRKRSQEDLSLTERVFAVIASFLRLVRQSIFRDTAGSRKGVRDTNSRGATSADSQTTDDESKYEKTFRHFWHTIGRAVNERNLSKLLPDSPLPMWLERRVRDVREIMNEMQGYDNFRSLRILSPRIMAMSPTDDSVTRILSPDLLRLYGRGKVRSATLHKLIDEVSIWSKLISNGFSKAKHSSTANTLKEMQARMGQLDKSLSEVQLETVSHKGYAFLREDQLKLLYDERTLPVQPALYSRMSDEEKEEALEEYIVSLASESSKRKKRNAVLLSPFFSMGVVNGPSILGPLILSPLFASNIVLSPQLLSPAFLSPAFASALVLTPILLSPLILSPQILSPYVLSPILLTPFILSPFILSPSILSPMALTPYLGSPSILSLNLLSPLTHCPTIMSPQVLVATILSPSAYSPSVNSSCAGCLLVASPCFMC